MPPSEFNELPRPIIETPPQRIRPKEMPKVAEIPEMGSGGDSEAEPASQSEEELKKPLVFPKPQAIRPVLNASGKSQAFVSVEKILEADLKDVYNSMPPGQKAKFKKVGEQTALQISNLIKQTKVQVNKIFELIRRWLMIIPGVSSFFLEQESKIKTDSILKLQETLKKQGQI